MQHVYLGGSNLRSILMPSNNAVVRRLRLPVGAYVVLASEYPYNIERRAQSDSMEEPDWMTVLRVFWEENLGFEYTGDEEEVASYLPNREELEDINATSIVDDLLKTGHLEVEWVDLRHDDSVGISGFDAIQMSEKGRSAVLNWELMKTQQQWQEEYEDERLGRQQQFEEAQVTRTTEVNAAIGYLTVGLLVVTLFDVFLAVPQDFVPPEAILGLVLLVVLGLIFKIYRSGLLNPRSPSSR